MSNIFLTKQKKLYNLENLPQLTPDVDYKIANLEIHSWLKTIFSSKPISNNENIDFYIASYSENTSDSEYDKIFPKYLFDLLRSPNLLLANKNSVTVWTKKKSHTHYYRLYNLRNEQLWIVENILENESVYFFLFEKYSYDKLKTKMKYSQTKKTETITDNPKEFTFLEKLFYSIDSDKTPYYYEDNIFYPKSLQNLTDSLNDYYENDFDDIKAEVYRISAIRETFQNRFSDVNISLKNIFEIKVDDIQDDLIKNEVEEIVDTVRNSSTLSFITSKNDVYSYIYNVFINLKCSPRLTFSTITSFL